MIINRYPLPTPWCLIVKDIVWNPPGGIVRKDDALSNPDSKGGVSGLQCQPLPNECMAWERRVRRLMREMGLLGNKFPRKARTTNSNHPFPRHENLVKDLTVTRTDQVWVHKCVNVVRFTSV